MKNFIYQTLRKLFLHDTLKLEEYDRIFTLEFIEKNAKIRDFANFTEEYFSYFEKYIVQRYLRNKIIKSFYDTFSVNKKIHFTEQFQDQLFRILFSSTRIERFFHYTSFDSLISILQNKKIRFSGIAGLNDRSETYYSDFLLNKNIKNPFHHTRIKSFNSKFILSNSLVKDELNQWRLYGENGSGICLEFQKNTNSTGYYFVFGKIAYGSNIFSILLELIIGLIENHNALAIFSQMDLWKNFVKHEDYKQENEIRIVFYNNKKYGNTETLTFRKNSFNIFCPYVEFDLDKLPFSLTGIRLGPKFPDKELNKGQLRYFLNSNLMNDVAIQYSNKTHYR